MSVFLGQNLILRRQVEDLQEEVRTLRREATDAQIDARHQANLCARARKRLRQLEQKSKGAAEKV